MSNEEYVVKSYEERMEVLKMRSKQTLEDAYEKLNKYGKCMIVRPTGFGKTFSLIQIARHYDELYPDKRIMYVYPSKIITTEIKNNAEDERNEFYPLSLIYGKVTKTRNVLNKDTGEVESVPSVYSGGNIDFVTMSAICDYWGGSTQGFISSQQNLLSEIASGKYSIILFDEMHKCASENFKKFYDDIAEYIAPNKTHMVGVTATPNRSKEEENEWLHNYMFGGIETFKYNMVDAITDGILLLPYCPTMVYDRNSFIRDYKNELKSSAKAKGNRFDEERVDIDISKCYEANGSEPEIIYDSLKHVGYSLNSSEVDESCLKFIVFFKDTQDMVERGTQIEQWFFTAFNELAKKDLGLRKDFTFNVDYVISDTADKFNDNIVTEHCKKEDYRTCYLDATKIGRDAEGRLIKPKARHINLIFNVDVITVGYHVEGVAGVMLMRNAGTEITYFQQIGRAFSVKGKKQPIIFDVVRNVDKNFKPTRKRIQDAFVEGAGIDTNTEEGKKVLNMLADTTIMATGFENALDNLMSKFGETKVVNADRDSDILFYYTELYAPLYIIANTFDMSISEVVKVLVKNNVQINNEDAVYRDLATKNNDEIGKYMYSKLGDKDYREKTGLKVTAYRKILNVLSGKNGDVANE